MGFRTESKMETTIVFRVQGLGLKGSGFRVLGFGSGRIGFWFSGTFLGDHLRVGHRIYGLGSGVYGFGRGFMVVGHCGL